MTSRVANQPETVTPEMLDAGEAAYDAEPSGYGAHRRALGKAYTAMRQAHTVAPADEDAETVEAVKWFVREAARFADLTLGDDATVEQLIPIKHFKAVAAIAERAHRLQKTFDLRWDADMRAVARWREANPGNDLVLPDRADLGEWLIAERLASKPADDGLREEVERLTKLLNTPEVDDFAKGAVFEAAHQRERWGVAHDAGKTPFDWFWLVGYLAQKAATAAVAGDNVKAMHHTISTAAALANWHLALSGTDTIMRPGIGPDNGGEKLGSAYDLATRATLSPPQATGSER